MATWISNPKTIKVEDTPIVGSKFACKYITASNKLLAKANEIYGVIEGIGLIYDINNPITPRATNNDVLIAPKTVLTLFNGILIVGILTFGKPIFGNVITGI